MEFVYDDYCLQTNIFVNEHCTNGSTSSAANKLDDVIMKSWRNAQNDGLCKYVLKVQCKRLPGALGLVVQRTTQRLNKRKAQFFASVSMPVDNTKFNFTQVKNDEILFKIRKIEASLFKDEECCHGMSKVLDSNSLKNTSDLCLINVSPFAPGHILLVPNLYSCSPQILTTHALELALEVQCLSRKANFMMVFNGMCAHASVNHLHLHCYYMIEPSNSTDRGGFPYVAIQNPALQCDILVDNCYVCSSLPVPGFVFQISTASQIAATAMSIVAVTDYFVHENIAHNLSIVRSTTLRAQSDRVSTDHEAVDELNAVRVFLWPRSLVTGAKDELTLNVAACELSGHVQVQDQALYETATQEMLTQKMSSNSLPADRFRMIIADVKRLLTPKDEPA